MEDVGKPKAQVAAEYIMRRFKDVKVEYYTKRIQEFNTDFYERFHIIIGGLDNVEARRWMNSTLHSMVQFEESQEPIMSTVRPFIDGGTEGLQGQSRVIYPFISNCYECSLSSMSNEKRYNICTLAETPRVPEHCIEYVYIKEWNEQMKRKLNTDSKEDMTWIYERALKRAEAYGIQGVTYMLTMGVLKHIIPAVATTNAIVAASCVSEALKIGTTVSVHLDNQMQYSGQTGTYAFTFQYERSDNCIVCGNKPIEMVLKSESKLSDFMNILKQAPYNLKNPSVRSNSASLYMNAPKSLEEELRPRLDMTWKQLKAEKLVNKVDSLSVTDSTVTQILIINIELQD
eukprot:TRINITY_DN5387_c0_g1_i10.p1 TRINITY_DN5387_c0_g1~~TRINITY_DN5387_c0_g1_i10.p1  ORF type:complete len:344 (-),score=72.14 TRINITY_DN5387_c0_g1_i10:118-1149(-)